MAIHIYRKNTAGRRGMSIVKSATISRSRPEKSLMRPLSATSGRALGKISVRHKGGRHKRRYRLIDFRQTKLGIPGVVRSVERDPNRSAWIALVVYADGEKRYILATEGMVVGQTILTATTVSVSGGNRMQLANMPIGTEISNVELFVGKGGQIARSAGSRATLTALEKNMAHVRLSSGEIRLISDQCYATIGAISNFEHGAIRIGKAGRARHLGHRPVVRGTVMNPVDHPHGGGEGRTGVGLKHPKTPWGKPALGKKTRRSKRYSNRFILKRRTKKR